MNPLSLLRHIKRAPPQSTRARHDTNHATMIGVRLPIPGSSTGIFMTSKLKFHTPFTIAEADALLTQAEAKRDELDKQYGSLVDGIPWFSKHELQPKRPFRTLEFYLKQLLKVHTDIQQLEHAIDEATRGAEAITSEKMWELAERMGLKYPQIEAQHE